MGFELAPFSICWSVRQGYPLSPILFSPPGYSRLRPCIRTPQAYAFCIQYILLYVSAPHTSLPNLFAVLFPIYNLLWMPPSHHPQSCDPFLLHLLQLWDSKIFYQSYLSSFALAWCPPYFSIFASLWQPASVLLVANEGNQIGLWTSIFEWSKIHQLPEAALASPDFRGVWSSPNLAICSQPPQTSGWSP